MPKIGETEVLFQRDACPDCNCGKRVYEEKSRAEMDAGRFSKEIFNAGIGIPEAGYVWDTVSRNLTIPQVIALYDYCSKCGEKYLVRILCRTVQTPQPQMAGMPGLPRRTGPGGFPKFGPSNS